MFQGYLCFGYDAIGSADQYDIKWTTPHCVLTLRLIAVVVDVYDGQKNPVSTHPENVNVPMIHSAKHFWQQRINFIAYSKV